jgi:hypothetical protein
VNSFTNYVYLLHGQEGIYYAEAAYSIATLLKKMDAACSRVIVFTDQPARVRSWPVICESIVDEVDSMKGETGFGHRVKIGVIAKCFQSYPGNVLYLDSDTIISGSIQNAAGSIHEGCALMHRFEFMIRRHESKNPWSKLAGVRTKLGDESAYSYGADSWMYNAGVIGLHRADLRVLDAALKICDAMLRVWGPVHITEQVAFSEAFRVSKIKILEAQKWITHYCRTKDKEYMRKRISRLCGRLEKMPWEFEQRIPYTYPRVLLSKILRKAGLE